MGRGTRVCPKPGASVAQDENDAPSDWRALGCERQPHWKENRDPTEENVKPAHHHIFHAVSRLWELFPVMAPDPWGPGLIPLCFLSNSAKT